MFNNTSNHNNDEFQPTADAPVRGSARSRRAALLAGGVIATALAAGGVALAHHDPNVIHACSHEQTGALRQVAGDEDCNPSESPVEWGIVGPEGPMGPVGPMGPMGPVGPVGPTGPQGPIGPAGADGADGANGAVGPAGPAGPQGPAGPSGLSGYEIVSESVQSPFFSNGEIVRAHCPDGKVVVGGGHVVDPMVGRIQSSRPAADGSHWFLFVDNLGGNTPYVASYAICVDEP